MIGIESDEDFAALRHISTWAVCNFRESESADQQILNAEKLELGRMAKRIFEYGRAQNLASLGYKVEVFKYVNFDVSPENLLIVGNINE
jgi:mevalonate pyrophosphate decarboxylase